MFPTDKNCRYLRAKNEAKGRSREWGIKGCAQRILIELINFELAVKWRNEARYTVIYAALQRHGMDNAGLMEPFFKILLAVVILQR